jgi:hypothetical protein
MLTRGLLEWLGARWYGSPPNATCPRPIPSLGCARSPTRFHPARRVLNVTTDSYLFRVQSVWFTQPG